MNVLTTRNKVPLETLAVIYLAKKCPAFMTLNIYYDVKKHVTVPHVYSVESGFRI
jgi:phage FluMu protein Com